MKQINFGIQRIWIRVAPILILTVFSVASCDFDPDASRISDSILSESEMAQPSEASQSSGSVQVIDAKTAREMMNDGEAYILVDVRTEDEFNQGHIEGALLLPYDRINTLASTLIPDTSSRILLYCRSGRRSALAAEALIDMGYTNVYDFGGINDWPYEVVS